MPRFHYIFGSWPPTPRAVEKPRGRNSASVLGLTRRITMERMRLPRPAGRWGSASLLYDWGSAAIPVSLKSCSRAPRGNHL
jgi:hypothetical protein